MQPCKVAMRVVMHALPLRGDRTTTVMNLTCG